MEFFTVILAGLYSLFNSAAPLIFPQCGHGPSKALYPVMALTCLGEREAVKWLYGVGVSMIKVGYPKYIAQENGNFNNVHAWNYDLYVDESYTLLRCPWHGDGCGIRISRGLFKCTTMNNYSTPTSQHAIFY